MRLHQGKWDAQPRLRTTAGLKPRPGEECPRYRIQVPARTVETEMTRSIIRNMASFRRIALSGAGILLLIVAALQFVRPERTNPPVDPADRLQAHLEVPAEVQAILDRSCRDCHTNETRWPWYSAVAPMSFLLVHDVTEGRDELNFSEWGQYDDETLDQQLDHICKQVTDGAMPLKPYALMHPEARLSSRDAERLCQWTSQVRAALPVQPAQ